MKIIEVGSKIIKWNNTNTDFVGEIDESDKPFFTLVTNPIHGNVLSIKDNIYITNIDTDFILDIDIESMLSFSKESKELTTADLYEMYSEVKDNENKTILEKGDTELRYFWTVLHMNNPILKRTFENLEPDLKILLKENPTTLN